MENLGVLSAIICSLLTVIKVCCLFLSDNIDYKVQDIYIY